MIPPPPRSTLFPYTTLFRSLRWRSMPYATQQYPKKAVPAVVALSCAGTTKAFGPIDRKSTRLNSSHANISYAVFCLKKKKRSNTQRRSEHENQQGSQASQAH